MARPVGSVSFVGYSPDAGNGVVFKVLQPVLAGDVITIPLDGLSGGDAASWNWTSAVLLAAAKPRLVSLRIRRTCGKF